MFRAYEINGPPATSATTAANTSTHANINSTASQSNHHLGSGKDTSFFNQIENNLRSWHTTNYSLYPSPQPPPPPVPTTTPRGLDHGIVGSGFADSDRRHHVEKAARAVGLDQVTQQQNQFPGHQDYDNVLRRMMSTASIGLGKPSSRILATNPNRSNGFQNCNLNTLQSLAQIHGKPYFQGVDDHIPEEAAGYIDNSILPLNSPARSSPHSVGSDSQERYSRKVFVGGLPPDIDEDEITASFRRFGPLVVDWPHKAESKSYFPPKGYAFLLFQDESSVQQLIESCITDDDKLYLCVSSPTIKDKPVQIRPWRLSDADFVLDGSMALDPRKTVFVGGVPRPLRASELAMIMNRLYGGVCYAGIDTDPELKYPKGAGRVAFSNQQSYISAISARFVQLQHVDIDKRVEVKPYVLDDQMCDECQGQLCSGKYAPYFCANVTCLQYYCEQCWATIHSKPGREYHKPLVKEGADRPRAVPFRWC